MIKTLILQNKNNQITKASVRWLVVEWMMRSPWWLFPTINLLFVQNIASMRFSENKLSVSVFGFKVCSRVCSNTPVQNIISRKAFYPLDNTERYFTKTSPDSKPFTYALRPLKQKLLVVNIVCGSFPRLSLGNSLVHAQWFLIRRWPFTDLVKQTSHVQHGGQFKNLFFYAAIEKNFRSWKFGEAFRVVVGALKENQKSGKNIHVHAVALTMLHWGSDKCV